MSSRPADAERHFPGSREGVEFRAGSMPETSGDCDAAVLRVPLAHERCGGRPVIGLAQVRVNTRAAGSPALILTPPPRPLGTASTHPTDAEVEAWALSSMRAAIAAYVDHSGVLPEAKVIIHLEAAAFDRPDLTRPCGH